MATTIPQTIESLQTAIRNKQTLRIIIQRTKLNQQARKHPAEFSTDIIEAIHSLHQVAVNSDPDHYIQETISKSALSLSEDDYRTHLQAAAEGRKSELLEEYENALAVEAEADHSIPAALVSHLVNLTELVNDELLGDIDYLND